MWRCVRFTEFDWGMAICETERPNISAAASAKFSATLQQAPGSVPLRIAVTAEAGLSEVSSSLVHQTVAAIAKMLAIPAETGPLSFLRNLRVATM